MTEQLTREQCLAMSEAELDVMERKIAGKYMHRLPWTAVFWGIGNCLVFFSLFPLVFLDVIPLWLGFVVATINMILAYLPSHEAQHSIIAGRGKPLRWLNELVGHASTLPLVRPYRVLRATHMEHHKNCNHPEKDSDIDLHASSSWQFLWQTLVNFQPGSKRSLAYPQCLERLGQEHLLIDAYVMQGIWLAIMFGMALTGYALEAALLWWLPKIIGETYLTYYLGWAPHNNMEEGRYKDTRAFKSRIGNVLSLGLQYHIVHHLYDLAQ
jgi:beta-carotene hydroxylase